MTSLCVEWLCPACVGVEPWRHTDYKDRCRRDGNTHNSLRLRAEHMGRPKKYKTHEEEADQQEARRASSREQMLRLRANPEYRAEVAATKGRRRAEDPELQARENAHSRLNKQRRRPSHLGDRVMENFQRRVRQSRSGTDGRFQLEFLSVEFQPGCRVCDRHWFNANLSTMISAQDFEKMSLALQVLREAFPTAT